MPAILDRKEDSLHSIVWIKLHTAPKPFAIELISQGVDRTLSFRTSLV